MTPFSAPGAAAKPPAATPRAPILAGAPRPVMGSYGNLGTPVRVAPSLAPRVQAPPTARMPIARPRMPLAPHAQGAPIPGAPRPMAGFAAASPTPRMQQAPPRAPGIPPNTRGVGVAVLPARPHMPLLQPTQRAAPAVANPAAPSLAKRALPTTMGPAPVQQAKHQATMPRPQGAPTGGVPLPTNPAVVVRAPVPPKHAQGAPTTPSRPPPLQVPVFGVRSDPSKGWMARVVDPKRGVPREIGPFDDIHLAALAQDRVAIACAGRGIGGGGAPLNFEPAFYRVETAFLHRWEGDLCGALEEGKYEKVYSKFLRAGYKAALNLKEEEEGDNADAHEDELIAICVGDAEFFWDDIEHFFLHRAAEIGKEALEEKGNRDLLRTRFVEMHRNMALCPDWRRDNQMKKLKTMMIHNQQKQQLIQMQQQQQQEIQMQQQQQVQIQQQQQQQIQMQPQQQQQIQMQQEQQPQQIQWQQQQQIQMKQEQQPHQIQRQQQHQIQMQQERRQQQFQQQQQMKMMMIQKQQQQQMMSAQQQQQYLDDGATMQVKQELSYSSSQG